MSDPFAKIVAHSISPHGIPLITIHLRYWRGIHSEVMTHRVFSRNARSSRAVPIQKMIDEVRHDPFVPRHWGKNQKGMQAAEECNEPVTVAKPLAVLLHSGPELAFRCEDVSRERAWIEASEKAIEFATAFMDAGYHKQIVNRILEPFMWIDTLVTATDWANFMALRDHKDAEPHIRDLAQQIKEAIGTSEPRPVHHGDWHLPYVSQEEIESWAHQSDSWADYANAYKIGRKVSAARCARISYAPFNGNSSVEAELERFALLVENQPVHASPVEHQATPDGLYDKGHGPQWVNPSQHRNFHGWRQYRAMIEGETVRDSHPEPAILNQS